LYVLDFEGFYALDTKTKTYKLNLPKSSKKPKANQHVQIKGIIKDGEIDVSSESLTSVTANSAVNTQNVPSTIGNQKVLVILATSALPKTSVDYVMPSVTQLYNNVSYSKVNMTYSTVGPYSVYAN